MSSIYSNWYAVQVRTGHEEEMIAICRPLLHAEDGEEVFIIQKKKEMHGAKRSRWTVKVPMFPGYIFVKTDDIERVRRSLRVIVQFKRILRSGAREFLPLYAEEVRLFEGLGGEDHVIEMSVGWKEGDRVGILDGPLVLMQGIIIKVNKQKNIAQIETRLFGETKKIWIGLKFLASKTEAESIVWKMRRNNLLAEEVYEAKTRKGDSNPFKTDQVRPDRQTGRQAQKQTEQRTDHQHEKQTQRQTR